MIKLDNINTKATRFVGLKLIPSVETNKTRASNDILTQIRAADEYCCLRTNLTMSTLARVPKMAVKTGIHQRSNVQEGQKPFDTKPVKRQSLERCSKFKQSF